MNPLQFGHKKFSPIEDDMIRKCLAENPDFSARDVTKWLGTGRSRETVRKRMHKLGLREIKRLTRIPLDPAIVADNHFRRAMRDAGYHEQAPVIRPLDGRTRTYHPEPSRFGNCCLVD